MSLCVVLDGADLREADITGAVGQFISLRGANLDGLDLELADFRGAMR